MKNDRIAVELPLPSSALKDFLKNIITNDDSFASALENPMGAMRQSGVNLNSSNLIPSDLATFFGAVAGLKQVIKEKKINDITFEKIFGQAAVVRGTILDAELTRGFFREWDNRDAFQDRTICVSTEHKFEALRERVGSSLKNALQQIDVKLKREVAVDMQRDLVSQTFESSETNNHTKTDWSNPNDMQTNKGSDRGVSKSFEGTGKITVGDLVSGPLINPIDLIALSARLQGFTQVLNQIEKI